MRKTIACLLLLAATLIPHRAPAYILNLSTRLEIPPPFLGEDATSFIGGFIVGSLKSRQVLVRALGPSLANFGLVPLADPTLVLYDENGTIITSNDNWMDSQADAISATGLAPNNPLEAAILITLDPGTYTTIVRGQGIIPGGGIGTSGNALLEVYDLAQTATLQNISARGAIQSDLSPMISGFIIASGFDNTVLIRAIGPSLDSFGLTGLKNPRLDLIDSEGNTIASNDNWQDSQSAEISATGLAPADPLESAILMTLVRGSYTAILTAVDSTDRGTALAEVYKIE